MHNTLKREFRYPPVIIRVQDPYTGGGTIDRTELGVVFANGEKLDELPPATPVVKDEQTGIFHVLKTARVFEASRVTAYKVEKRSLFLPGDAVTIGGAYDKASDVITSVDRSNVAYDVINVAATIGAAAKGDVLVLAKDKQAAGSAVPKYGKKDDLEVFLTVSPVDLTVPNEAAGLMVSGAVNAPSMIAPMDKALRDKTRIYFEK